MGVLLNFTASPVHFDQPTRSPPSTVTLNPVCNPSIAPTLIMTGRSLLLVVKEAFVVQLERLDRDRALAGVERGDRPLLDHHVAQVPVDDLLLVGVLQLDRDAEGERVLLGVLV